MKLVGVILHIADFAPFVVPTVVVDSTDRDGWEAAVAKAVADTYRGATIKMSRFYGYWIIEHHGVILGQAQDKVSFD